MLVIHPTDRTTEMLSILYEGLEARLIEADCSNKEMGLVMVQTKACSFARAMRKKALTV